MNDSELGILLTNLSAALLLTIAAETPVTAVYARKGRYLLFNFWCNVLTNPLLNLALFFIRRETGDSAYRAVAIGELLVLYAEYRLYRLFDENRRSKRWYFGLSLTTNAFSYTFGVIFFAILA